MLISRHRDGEINAIAAERLGIETIRGSGHARRRISSQGRRERLQRDAARALQEGYNVALTADVPKVARVAGLGIVKLAQASGRPIYPSAIAHPAPHRARQLGPHRDQSAVRPRRRRGGEPIRVPADADDATLEMARRALEDALNAATARAYAIADGTRGERPWLSGCR